MSQEHRAYHQGKLAVDGLFCQACLEDKRQADISPDPRYCQGCYGFLVKEAELLDDRKRKPTWVPKDSQSIPRTPLEPSCKPIQPTSGVGHNCIDTQIGSGSLSRALPYELIRGWVGEGMGSRVIALKLNNELGIKVSYKTIQRLLSGERDRTNVEKTPAFILKGGMVNAIQEPRRQNRSRKTAQETGKGE